MSGKMRWDTVTEPTFDANLYDGSFWSLHDRQRDELRELVTAHGFDPLEVRSVSYDVIDAPLLRIRVYLTDDQGRRCLDITGDDAATQYHEVALRAPLPTWWRPVFTEA